MQGPLVIIWFILHLITSFFIILRGPKDKDDKSILWIVFYYISLFYLGNMFVAYVRIILPLFLSGVIK